MVIIKLIKNFDSYYHWQLNLRKRRFIDHIDKIKDEMNDQMRPFSLSYFSYLSSIL